MASPQGAYCGCGRNTLPASTSDDIANRSITFSACGGVTNAGVALLGVLPHLRGLSLENMPNVTREGIASIPRHLNVNFET